MVGSSTSRLIPIVFVANEIMPFVTLGDATATLTSGSLYVVGTQTLQPGGPAIPFSGTPVSLTPEATAVVIGSSTSNLVPTANAVSGMGPLSILGDETATLDSGSLYLVGTQTLTPGGSVVTSSGTHISLALGAIAVVVGSSTSILTTFMGVGDYVWAGIAGVLSGMQSSTSLMPESGEAVITTILSTADDDSVVTQTETMLAEDASATGEATTRHTSPSGIDDESASAAATDTAFSA
jgi:hypothetical protein